MKVILFVRLRDKEILSQIYSPYLSFYLACHGLEKEQKDLYRFGNFKSLVSVTTMRAQRDSLAGKKSNAGR